MDFVGQVQLIDKLRRQDARSVLIQGPPHFGKKTLLRFFCAKQGYTVYEVSGNANTFRQSLEFMQTQVAPMVYIIPDVDMLHVTVQNMLLKVLEEPPMKSKFYLTASNGVLPTIKSRCVTYMCEPYSTLDIQQVIQMVYPFRTIDSPGRLQILIDNGYSDKECSEDFKKLLDLFQQIKAGLNGSIAPVLVKGNEIGKLMKNRDYFLAYLLSKEFFSKEDGVPWSCFSELSEHYDTLDRYQFIAFLMSLWKEVQLS